MADPICRWRNPYLPTVMELIGLLPKEELPQSVARDIVNHNYGADFYRTPYQLACQLGLYHETDGFYFPKFTFDPTEDEIQAYLENWIVHYSVPNPYTRSLQDVPPFSIHSEICRRLNSASQTLEWENVRNDIFSQEIGNNDILVNSINAYSKVISINNGLVELKEGKTYADLAPFIDVDINIDRNNKEYFFDLFDIPNITDDDPNSDIDIITNVSRQEMDLINQLQNATNYSQTEKNQIIKARIGQGYFRRNLIEDCAFCPITLIDDIRLLTASHIKPWRDSNNEERLNAKNGLLFTPTYDKLFDKGYITFRNDKSMIISSLVTESNILKLGISTNMEIEYLPIDGRETYLEYHRNEIFQA
jgi:hypothetical protein